MNNIIYLFSFFISGFILYLIIHDLQKFKIKLYNEISRNIWIKIYSFVSIISIHIIWLFSELFSEILLNTNKELIYGFPFYLLIPYIIYIIADSNKKSISSNISPNISSNISPNIASNISPNIASNISPNIASNISPNIASNIATTDEKDHNIPIASQKINKYFNYLMTIYLILIIIIILIPNEIKINFIRSIKNHLLDLFHCFGLKLDYTT